MALEKFIAELRRRNVVRVGIAYLALAWLAIQLINELGPILGMPDWFPRLALGLLAIGFLITVALSWVYELTDRGIRTTAEVDSDVTLRPIGGRGLDFVIIGLLLLALAYFVWESRFSPPGPPGQIQSIAVLPFEDLSEKRDQEYLADGMAEELLNALTRLPDLKVSGRTSSFAFKGQAASPERIARELGVTHLLEGSIRTSGSRLRVSARLVNAASGFQLWSREFDGSLADIFAVQDQISAGVVEGLKLQVGSGETAALAESARTPPESYDEYLLGRYHFARRTAEGLEAAMRHFRAAIAIDPAYAPAHAALATALAVSPYYLPVASASAVASAAVESAQRALALDPESSEAHAALGAVYMAFERDWSSAARHLERAIELNPSHAGNVNLYGDYFYVIGDYRSALHWEGRAVELEPLAAVNRHELALVYGLLGRLDDAIRAEREAVGLSPEFRNAWSSLGRMLIDAGRFEEFDQLLEANRALLSTDSQAWLGAWRELALGNRAAARDYADRVLEESRRQQHSLTHPAFLYARLGDDATAAAVIEEAWANGDPILISPLYFFLPEDFPAMPRVQAALDQPGLRPLYDLRRIHAESGRGRAHGAGAP